MILWILDGLNISWSGVLQSYSIRIVAMSITSLLFSLSLGPGVIRYLSRFKIKQIIREEGPSWHEHKNSIPTMGGILILASIIFSSLLWLDWSNIYSFIFVFTLILFGFIGALDDGLKLYKKESEGLNIRQKFILQFFVSLFLVIWIYSIQNKDLRDTLGFIPFSREWIIDLGKWIILLELFVILGSTNSVNITDGLDGLATGLLLISFFSFLILAYITGRIDFSTYLSLNYLKGSGELSVALAAVVGALLGFLWYNIHPAQIMMGDTGSLALGSLMGIVSIILKKELFLIFFAFLFIIEVCTVIIQIFFYKRFHKRIFLMAPIHHHFELLGWNEIKIVVRFWIIGLLVSIIGLGLLRVDF